FGWVAAASRRQQYGGRRTAQPLQHLAAAQSQQRRRWTSPIEKISGIFTAMRLSTRRVDQNSTAIAALYFARYPHARSTGDCRRKRGNQQPHAAQCLRIETPSQHYT